MKSINKFFVISLTALAILLPACHQYEPVSEDAFVTEENSWKATMTIGELVDTYLTVEGDIKPVRENDFNKDGVTPTGVFSIDTLPRLNADGSNAIIIRGRIVSEDVAGNLYKTLVIQDEKHPEQGLKLSIDAGSLSGIYPIGQLVAIRCNGLVLGKYAAQVQLGVAFFNTDKEPDWQPGATGSKVGWEPGRIPLPIFQKAVQLIETPNKSKLVVDSMEVSEITGWVAPYYVPSEAGYKSIAQLASRLVRLKNVYFTQISGDPSDVTVPANSYNYEVKAFCDLPDTIITNESDMAQWRQQSSVFAPESYKSQGYPQGRNIATVGSPTIWMSVSTSEYAKFAQATIPSPIYDAPSSTATVVGQFEGDIIGILGVYSDKGKNVGYMNEAFSLTIRSLKDIQLKATADGYYRIGQTAGEESFKEVKKDDLWYADDVFYPRY